MYKNNENERKFYLRDRPQPSEDSAKWIYLKEPLLCGIERQAFIERIAANVERLGGIQMKANIHMKMKHFT